MAPVCYRVVLEHDYTATHGYPWLAVIYPASNAGDESGATAIAGERGKTRDDALEHAAEWVRSETATRGRPETVYLDEHGRELEL